MPIMRRVFPALRSFGGRRILIASFLRKPSGLPVCAIARVVLTLSASFNPAVILSALRLLDGCCVARLHIWSRGDCAAHVIDIRKTSISTPPDLDIPLPPLCDGRTLLALG